MSDEKKGANLEATVDVVTAGVAVVNPLAAALMTLVNKGGHAFLRAFLGGGVEKEKDRLEDVLVRAATAIGQDNTEAAFLDIDALLEDECFRAQAWTTARQMLEAPPCEEAHQPIAMLIAEYKRKRVDAEFRRWLGFLCDVSTEELGVLKAVGDHFISLKRPTLHLQIKSPTQPVVLIANYGVLNAGESASLDLDGAESLMRVLEGHDLAVERGVAGRSPGAGTGIFHTAPENLRFAAKLLGIPTE